MKGWILIFALAGLAGCASQPAKEQTAKSSEGRFLHIAGNQIHYVSNDKAASADETPFVYVHGLGGSLSDFSELIQANHPAGSTRLYFAFDLPLFGQSRAAEEDFSIPKYVEVLQRVIERVAPKKVNLVCHSMGGQICIEYALQKPDAIELLTLIAPAGIYDRTTYLEKMISQSNFEIPWPFKSLLRKEPDLSWFDRAYVRQALAKNPVLLMAIGSFKENVRAKVKDLKTKTLIIWGRDDDVFNYENGAFLKSQVQNSTLLVIDRAGHVPMKNHSARIAKEISKEMPKVAF